MSDVRGVMYDKDVVWVNVPGCFNRVNLVGRLFIVEIFEEFGFTNTWPDPLGAKGQRMVLDLQDAKRSPRRPSGPDATSCIFSASLPKFSL